MPQRIHEQATLSEATASGSATSGRMMIQVLTPGQGSSGYYSQAVCESAAPLVQAGTPMYLDHPTESDQWQRPERSLRDLAAVFTGAGAWDADLQAVVAEAQVFAPYREVLTEMAPFIGVSVRGDGNIVEGALPTGGMGRVVESIDRIASVDFVTAAGRGGKVLALLESARGDVTRRAVRRGLAEATVNDTREQLDNALKDANPGDKVWVSVRDFDATTVWFWLEKPDGEGTYQQSYATSDGAVSLTGDAVEVRVVTTYVPVNPAGQPTTQESQEVPMPNIEESELARLREADGRVQTLESERDTAVQRAETAEGRVTEATRTGITIAARARTLITEANDDLPTATIDRIVATATATVPLTEAGALDETAFATQVETARTAEETYLATLAEAAGAGRVTGLGLVPPKEDGEVTRKDTAAVIAEAFGRQPKTAKEA